MAVEFVRLGRDTRQLFPPSVRDYPREKHLPPCVGDIVDRLDLTHLAAAYATASSRPHHPVMLVALLFYGCATGIFSSRRLPQATYDLIAFRFNCVNSHLRYHTIADFRRRLLKELEALFVEILLSASLMTKVSADQHDQPDPLCWRA